MKTAARKKVITTPQTMQTNKSTVDVMVSAVSKRSKAIVSNTSFCKIDSEGLGSEQAHRYREYQCVRRLGRSQLDGQHAYAQVGMRMVGDGRQDQVLEMRKRSSVRKVHEGHVERAQKDMEGVARGQRLAREVALAELGAKQPLDGAG